MSQQIKNLVFEGGGIKGIAYVGALDALEKHNIALAKIQKLAGTSIGAIMALLIGLNYSQKEIADLLWDVDFSLAKDSSWGVLRDCVRLLKTFGICKGQYIQSWLEQIIEKKTANKRATFADIQKMKKQYKFKDIYFISVNLSTGSCEVFSHEQTPHLALVDAVRCSLAVPFIFPAVRMKKDEQGFFQLHDQGDIYIDGSIINNYPIQLFDKVKYLSTPKAGVKTNYYNKLNKLKKLFASKESYIFNTETLGLRLEECAKINVFKGVQAISKKKIIDNFKDYLFSLIDTIITAQQDYQHLISQDRTRTIYIDSLDVSFTDFNIDLDKKLQLIESGRRSVYKYFNDDSLPSSPETNNLTTKLNQQQSPVKKNNLIIISQILTLLTSISSGLIFYRDIEQLLQEIIKNLEHLE